jgi:hypothetical protein
MTNFLYRGVNAELFEKLNGVLRPKVQNAFSSSPRWGHAEWSNGYWGESANNAVIDHQRHQAGLPTSGISTTPHLARAASYATHGDKYPKGYVYVINRSLCVGLKVTEFVVNQIVPVPSVVEDDEVILVASNYGALPSELVVEVREIGP